MQRLWKAASLALAILAAEAVFASLGFVLAMRWNGDAEWVAFCTALGFVMGAFLTSVVVVGFKAVTDAVLEDEDPPVGIGA